MDGLYKAYAKHLLLSHVSVAPVLHIARATLRQLIKNFKSTWQTYSKELLLGSCLGKITQEVNLGSKLRNTNSKNKPRMIILVSFLSSLSMFNLPFPFQLCSISCYKVN